MEPKEDTGWSLCLDNWIGLTSAKADGKLAELAERLGKMVEHHVDQSQPNPTIRADGQPCRNERRH